MAAIRDKFKKGAESEVECENQSTAQQHLQLLLKKQLLTCEKSVEGIKTHRSKFAPAVEFKPLSQEVEGLQTLKRYRDTEEKHGRMDQLRELGLTTDEIQLILEDDGWDESGTTMTTGKKGKLSVEPSAQRQRMKAIDEKLSRKEELLKKPVRFSGSHLLSRHAMEVERSIHQGNPLAHLAMQDSTQHTLYPKSVIPDGSEEGLKDHKIAASSDQDQAHTHHSAEAHVEAEQGEEPGSSDGQGCAPFPLPIQVLERNKITVAEIRAMSRFRGYSAGDPSNVLYLKNLHHSVSQEDLHAVFECVQEVLRCSSCEGDGVDEGDISPHIRLLTGRMRGQAFVEYSSESLAAKALDLVNGYIMKGKPVIICFGKKK